MPSSNTKPVLAPPNQSAVTRRKPRQISTGRLQSLRLFSTLLAVSLKVRLAEQIKDALVSVSVGWQNTGFYKWLMPTATTYHLPALVPLVPALTDTGPAVVVC